MRIHNPQAIHPPVGNCSDGVALKPVAALKPAVRKPARKASKRKK
jgi:hypothetical protein